jgi:hypothetical protein
VDNMGWRAALCRGGCLQLIVCLDQAAGQILLQWSCCACARGHDVQ